MNLTQTNVAIVQAGVSLIALVAALGIVIWQHRLAMKREQAARDATTSERLDVVITLAGNVSALISAAEMRSSGPETFGPYLSREFDPLAFDDAAEAINSIPLMEIPMSGVMIFRMRRLRETVLEAKRVLADAQYLLYGSSDPMHKAAEIQTLAQSSLRLFESMKNDAVKGGYRSE